MVTVNTNNHHSQRLMCKTNVTRKLSLREHMFSNEANLNAFSTAHMALNYCHTQSFFFFFFFFSTSCWPSLLCSSFFFIVDILPWEPYCLVKMCICVVCVCVSVCMVLDVFIIRCDNLFQGRKRDVKKKPSVGKMSARLCMYVKGGELLKPKFSIVLTWHTKRKPIQKKTKQQQQQKNYKPFDLIWLLSKGN